MERIIKHRVIAYKPSGAAFELTPYVSNWTINNGGVEGGNTGLDGIVKTADITINNSLDANFNPESEFGVVRTKILQFIGDGTSSYPGVPDNVFVKSCSFNQILGQGTHWVDLPTWDNWDSWNLTDNTDNSDLYGNIRVNGNNFITPKPIREGVLFEIVCTYIDYSERNPINTFNDEFSPLLDGMTKVEIYVQHEEIQSMSYRWVADGTNRLPNPIPGTPLSKGIGMYGSWEDTGWDNLPSWDEWDPWDYSLVENEFFTQIVEYDESTDEIVLAKTPDAGTIIDFSISYFQGEPKLRFSGFLGDSILPDPATRTIKLSCRDKGKLLQDTMIDGLVNRIDFDNWFVQKQVQGFTITEVDTVTGQFTAPSHGLVTGDTVKFNNVSTLPTANGEQLLDNYTVTVIDPDTFKLDGITLEEKTNKIDLLFTGNITITGATVSALENTITDSEFGQYLGGFESGTMDIIDSGGLTYNDDGQDKKIKGYWFVNVLNTEGTIISLRGKEDPNSTVDINPLEKSIATGSKVVEWAERNVTVTPSTSTDLFTSNEPHLLEDGDLVRIQSTGTIPSGKLPDTSAALLEQIYRVTITEDISNPDTEFYLANYQINGSGARELKLVDITDTGTGVVSVYQLVMNVDEVIRNILNDVYGDGTNGKTKSEYLFDSSDVPANFDKRVNVSTDIWDQKTVWDAIQSLSTNKAMYLQHLYNEVENDFVLTLRNIPDKTTADYDLTSGDIYAQTQEITDADIRNFIRLKFYDSELGAINEVSSIDEASISAYGARPSLITEANSSGINSVDEAQRFADLVLEASKDRIVESTITSPILFEKDGENIEVTNTISVDYKYLDSTGANPVEPIPFYFVESIQHSFDATANSSRDRYKTVFRGNKRKVRTGVKRFKRIESRPGAYKQNIGRDLSELYTLPVPTDLSLKESGLESISLTPRAYAILQWNAPDNTFPGRYILEWREDGETYEDGEQRSIKANQARTVTERINLEPGKVYYWRVRAVSKTNVEGVIANEVSISAIGDSIPPSVPASVSVVGLDEGLQVSFNPNTENDLLGYKIYVRKGDNPTPDNMANEDMTGFVAGTYDKKKVTNSTITVISGLEPGTYRVGLTAFDTSGNESAISSIVVEKNSPKLVIRSQQDFENWATDMYNNDVTNYSEVIIYEKTSDYIIDDANIQMPIEITKPLKITGVGDIKILVNSIDAVNFITSTKSILHNNIDVEYNSAGASLPFFEMYRFDGISNQKQILFKDSEFKGFSDSTPSLVFRTRNSYSQTDVYVEKCLFSSISPWSLQAMDSESRFHITESRFRPANGEGESILLSDSENCVLSGNIIENTKLVWSTGGSNARVSNNKFVITNDNISNKNLIEIFNLTANGINIQDNQIYYNVTIGQGGYDFVAGFAETFDDSVITGNTFKTDTSGWLDSCVNGGTDAGVNVVISNNTDNTQI